MNNSYMMSTNLHASATTLGRSSDKLQTRVSKPPVQKDQAATSVSGRPTNYWLTDEEKQPANLDLAQEPQPTRRTLARPPSDQTTRSNAAAAQPPALATALETATSTCAKKTQPSTNAHAQTTDRASTTPPSCLLRPDSAATSTWSLPTLPSEPALHEMAPKSRKNEMKHPPRGHKMPQALMRKPELFPPNAHRTAEIGTDAAGPPPIQATKKILQRRDPSAQEKAQKLGDHTFLNLSSKASSAMARSANKNRVHVTRGPTC